MAKPIKFDPKTSIADQSGKVILITGGNDGIGKHIVTFLSHRNPFHIYILARNAAKTQSLISSLAISSPAVKITFIPCDLASLSSVKAATSQFLAAEKCLDILFCNAGIRDEVPSLTEDGYEVNFGVNHMGHALLIKELLPVMLETTKVQRDVRVVITGSDGYRFHASEGIVFKDLKTMQTNLTLMGLFGGWLRYFQSKLANLVYTIELARHYSAITFVSVHPGVVDTYLTPSFVKNNPIGRTMLTGGGLKTPEQGSFNSLWAATSKDVVSGEYYEPIGIAGKRTPKSKDKKLAAELWNYTEEQLKTFLG